MVVNFNSIPEIDEPEESSVREWDPYHDTLYRYYNPLDDTLATYPSSRIAILKLRSSEFKIELLTKLIKQQPELLRHHYYSELRLRFPNLIVELILTNLIFQQQEYLKQRLQSVRDHTIKVHAVNYNLLRVMSGGMGMSYSN